MPSVVEANATSTAPPDASAVTMMPPASGSGAIPRVATSNVTPPSVLRTIPSTPSAASRTGVAPGRGTAAREKTIRPASPAPATRAHVAPASADV